MKHMIVQILAWLGLMFVILTPAYAAPDAQGTDWDKPFSAPQYLIHATGHGTMDGSVKDDWWLLFPNEPDSKGNFLIADGSGGTFGYSSDYHAGPFTTARQVCAAALARGVPITSFSPWNSNFTFDCKQLNSQPTSATPIGVQINPGPTTPGEPLPPVRGPMSPPCTWTGTRDNPSWGKLILSQNGNQISGTYDHYIGPIPGSGQLSGTVSGNVLNGQWTQSNGNGTLQLTLGADCNISGGTWSYGNINPGTVPPGQPNTNATNMTIQAAQRQVIAGDLVLVPVWLIKANNVSNINFQMTYDANIVKPEGTLTKGNLLDNSLFTVNPNQAGSILSGFAQTSGLSGTGTVLNIPFRAIGKPGDRTPLGLTVTAINDPSGGKLAIDRIPGEILIYNKDGTFPPPPNGNPGPPPPNILLGDCDGDGSLTEVDALCALEMSVQLRPSRPIMDIDGSGDVTSRDAVIILQRAIGKQ
jgi:Cohesin domain